MMAGAVFDPLVERLSPTTTCHVPSLRGCGESPRAQPYTLDAFVGDLVRWLDAEGLSEFTLLGHSMGGQLAQLIAARQPRRIDKLILVCPVPVGGVPLPDEPRALFAASAGDRARQDMVLGAATTQLDRAERDRLLDIAATVEPACIRQALDAWTAGGDVAELARIRCPTHVVATSDPFLPADFLQAAVVDRIRGAQLHRLDGPGHYPANEAPDATADLILELLSA